MIHTRGCITLPSPGTFEKTEKEEYEVTEPDADFFLGAKQNAQKDLVVEMYRAASKAGAQEMTKGGIVTKIINGRPIQIAMPNTHEQYINSVKMLYRSLKPLIFHGATKDQTRRIFKKADEHEEKTEQTLSDQEENINTKHAGINPNKAASTQLKRTQEIQSLQQDYEEAIREIADLRFEAISWLLQDHNWFTIQGGSGGFFD